MYISMMVYNFSCIDICNDSDRMLSGSKLFLCIHAKDCWIESYCYGCLKKMFCQSCCLCIHIVISVKRLGFFHSVTLLRCYRHGNSFIHFRYVVDILATEFDVVSQMFSLWVIVAANLPPFCDQVENICLTIKVWVGLAVCSRKIVCERDISFCMLVVTDFKLHSVIHSCRLIICRCVLYMNNIFISLNIAYRRLSRTAISPLVSMVLFVSHSRYLLLLLH